MGSNPADKRHPVNLYTIGEEIANSITHGIGAGFSIVGLTVLIIFAAFKNSSLHIVSFSIYGATLVLLYLASTLYHSIQHPPAKRILQRIDHAAIYLLIAGTYTPFLLVSLRNAWGWTLLVVIWGLAILGIAYKLLFLEYYEKISALGYVLMGWLCLIAGRQLLTNLPMEILIWIAAGGVIYTAGVTFLLLRRIPFRHTIWHVFVLAGSLCHYYAVFRLLNTA
jgi:hemolysin III